MVHERRNHNLVVLPDGKILAVGGENNCTPQPCDPCSCDSVLPAEVFDPNAPEPMWTPWAEMTIPRVHHSSAVLLHDATVLACGGDGYASAEIFSPPYLFKNGNEDADRPLIGYAPTDVPYGNLFKVILSSGSPVGAAQIGKVSFVRLGSTTHGFDMDQRYVPLNFDVHDALGLEVKAPANGNLAPPGYYMLFLISDDGVPSIAKYVRLYEPVAI